MKTEVIMQSPDRELFGIIIRQQSLSGFLNLTDLQESYTVARVKNQWVEKNVTMILTNPNNLEVIYYLLEKQGVIKLSLLSFIENVENQGFASYMKSLGVYKTTGARHTKTTWCNPYIWMMVAMDLNPKFKAQVIGWLTDSLLINRIEAGNFYKAFSSQIAKFLSPDFSKIATALNFVVFGKHESGIRQTATKEQLKELCSVEEKMAFAMEMGYITSQAQLLVELRKMWQIKYNSKFLN